MGMRGESGPSGPAGKAGVPVSCSWLAIHLQFVDILNVDYLALCCYEIVVDHHAFGNSLSCFKYIDICW